MIARNWGVPPWIVDLAPSDEVDLELELLELGM
jgi:hypothetical protein